MTRNEIIAAIEAGRIEMQRPWGDWVAVRMRYHGASACGDFARGLVPVFMEAFVEASINRAMQRRPGEHWRLIDQPAAQARRAA